MTILVTGANGFVGRHLVARLVQRGETVVAGVGPSHSSSAVFAKAGCEVESVELRDADALRVLMGKLKPQKVFHLAGLAPTHGVSAEDYLSVNALGSYNLARAIMDSTKTGTKLLYVSSASVYASPPTEDAALDEDSALEPTSEYGASKVGAEMFLRVLARRGLNVVIARPFNHTGPGQGRGFLCPDLVHRLKDALAESAEKGTHPRLEVGRLHAVRDFTDVRDVVDAYISILDCFESGEVVNVCSGVGQSVGQIVEILVSRVANAPEVQLDIDADLNARADADVVVGNPQLLVSRTGWNPRYTLEDSLRALWEEGGAHP